MVCSAFGMGSQDKLVKKIFSEKVPYFRGFLAFLNKILKDSFIDRFGEIYGTVRIQTITNQILKKIT